MMNNLFNGGIYLFDVMVIMLVFDEVGIDIFFIVVLCGYYVDIGGKISGLVLFDS